VGVGVCVCGGGGSKVGVGRGGGALNGSLQGTPAPRAHARKKHFPTYLACSARSRATANAIHRNRRALAYIRRPATIKALYSLGKRGRAHGRFASKSPKLCSLSSGSSGNHTSALARRLTNTLK
jgi:hypothetical protein